MRSVSKKFYQKFLKLSVECWVILIILLSTILVISLPYIIRNSNILVGDESYYHLKIASLIQERGITNFDPLSYGGRQILTPLGWPFVLAKISSFLNISLELTSKLIPFIFGILTVILFYYLLKNIKVEKRIRTISTLVFIFSPIFIYLFSTSNYYFIPLFLNLLAFYFLLKDKKILTTILIALTTLFGIIHPLVGLIAVLIYTLIKNRKSLPWFYITLAITLILILLKYVPVLIKFGLPDIFMIDNLPVHQQLFSDLGGKISLSIFALILAFIGIVVTWKKKQDYITTHIIFIILFILSLFYIPILIYLNLLLAILVAFGVLKLIQRRWESKFIKNFTILILSLGLIFSGLSYAKQTADSLPNKDIVEGLSLIETDSELKTVFSHYSNGYWINYLAKKPNVMDPSFAYAPSLQQTYEDSQDLFYSRDLKNSTEIIERYNIGYILITPEMKEGKVWHEDEEGLLFLLEFSKNFRSVYAQKGVEVWEIRNLTTS